ncbi:NADPH-dependent 2,4-dienoyl-CoA reductase, partial [Streptomyces sp. SID10244]|nr:NADPH-dependent 2,4-dienoyl-CoA reductase [Streptomyces sp. SID10244]
PGFVTKPRPLPTVREVFLVQRKSGRQGKTLGKTTGWVHRATVKMKGVEQISGATYDKIDDQGLHLSFRGEDGSVTETRVLEVDNVV